VLEPHIPQALTSAFANNDLELTLRQASIAEQTGEEEFLGVNHCITIDNDFGFANKDFVKPTTGREAVH